MAQCSAALLIQGLPLLCFGTLEVFPALCLGLLPLHRRLGWAALHPGTVGCPGAAVFLIPVGLVGRSTSPGSPFWFGWEGEGNGEYEKVDRTAVVVDSKHFDANECLQQHNAPLYILSRLCDIAKSK